jgi:hypothetical protein
MEPAQHYEYHALKTEDATETNFNFVELIMANPEAIEMAQKLALMTVVNRPPEPARISGPADDAAQPARDPLTTLELDGSGH